MKDEIMRWFHYRHLPEGLMFISQKFHDLAAELTDELPDSRERSAGLRKLLEAKDCMVRAAREKMGGEPEKTDELHPLPLVAKAIIEGEWGYPSDHLDPDWSGAEGDEGAEPASEYTMRIGRETSIHFIVVPDGDGFYAYSPSFPEVFVLMGQH